MTAGRPDLLASGDDRRAALFMASSVACYSFMTLLFSLGGAASAPFLARGLWGLSAMLVVALALGWAFRGLLLDPVFRRRYLGLFLRRLPGWAALCSLVNSMAVVPYIWSMRFLDVSVTAVLGELWPVLFILSMRLMFPGRDRGLSWRRLLPLLLVSVAGVALVAAAQRGTLLFFLGHGAGDLGVGMSLVLASLLLGSTGPPVLRWGYRLAHETPAEWAPGRSVYALAMLSTLLLVLLGQVLGGLVNLGLGLAVGVPAGSASLVAAALVGGALLSGPGVVLSRATNLLARNYGVNALAYFQPLLALAWLGLAGRVDLPRPDYLVAGARCIVLSNLLVQAGPALLRCLGGAAS